MKGILVANPYLREEKYDAHARAFAEAFSKLGVPLNVVYGTFNECDADFAVFYDKNVALARLLEGRGIRVFNSSEAIAITDDKALTYAALAGEIPMPETVISPLAYGENQYPDIGYYHKLGDILGYPLVIKHAKGSFGAGVYLVNNAKEAFDTVKSFAPTPFVAQRFVGENTGRDIRVYIAANKIAGAVRRVNDGNFRANLSQGGRMEKVTLSEEQKSIALKAHYKLGLVFSGVDIFDTATPMVSEVNSCPHFKRYDSFSGRQTADVIARAVLESMR